MEKNDFKKKLILAPMADFTDIAFRQLCKDAGADIVISEMINTISIHRKTAHEKNILKTSKKQKPFGIQLFGSNKDDFEKAILELEKMRFSSLIHADFYDLNFGCPMQKIITMGSGARLLLHPKKMREIIEIVISRSSIPITAKIRLGFYKNNLYEIYDNIKDLDLCALTLHARTAKQKYSGSADWNAIYDFYEKINIPLIGNGDISSYAQANVKIKTKICDSVMIGRGALTNPFIFSNIFPITKEIKKLALIKYIDLARNYKILNLASVKLHAMQILSGFPSSAFIRSKISPSKSIEEILEIVNDI